MKIAKFLFLFGVVLLLFHNAVGLNVFLDDFFFLKIGRAGSIGDFLHFFSPFKTYFYRPLPTEVFYFFINTIHKNYFIAHLSVFIFYFVGLVFMYKSAVLLAKNKWLAYGITFLYAINFVHVFQLYQLATFIEVSLFTFIMLALYFYLKEKYILSLVFYAGALFSKETSMLFPFLLVLIHLFGIWPLPKKNIIRLVPYFVLAGAFYFLYRPSLTYVQATEPLYKIHLAPRLMINNLMWYSLWSLGLPNFLPVYLTSIFAKPLPDFWNLLDNPQYKFYIYTLVAYYSLLIPTGIAVLLSKTQYFKKGIMILLFACSSFFLLIAPTLPTIHKWMVRLTLPLVLVIVVQALILFYAYSMKRFYRVMAVVLFVLYMAIQLSAIPIHESSSLWLLDSINSSKAEAFFDKNRASIDKFNTIYFLDEGPDGGWGGSEKLRDALHDTDFLDVYFPGQNKKAYFDYRDKVIPRGSYVIDSQELLKQ